METIHETVKRIRKGLGLTQEEFAKKVGTSRVNITKYENGYSMPPADTYQRILDAATGK